MDDKLIVIECIGSNGTSYLIQHPQKSGIYLRFGEGELEMMAYDPLPQKSEDDGIYSAGSFDIRIGNDRERFADLVERFSFLYKKYPDRKVKDLADQAILDELNEFCERIIENSTSGPSKTEIHVSRERQEVIVPTTGKSYLFARCHDCRKLHYTWNEEITATEPHEVLQIQSDELKPLMKLVADYEVRSEQSDTGSLKKLEEEISEVSERIFAPYIIGIQ